MDYTKIKGFSASKDVIISMKKFFKISKIKFPYHPAIPLPGAFPGHRKRVSQRHLPPRLIIHDSHGAEVTTGTSVGDE